EGVAGEAGAAVGDDEVTLWFARAVDGAGAERPGLSGDVVVLHLPVQRVETVGGDRQGRLTAVEPGLHEPPEVQDVVLPPTRLRQRAARADRVDRPQRVGHHRAAEGGGTAPAVLLRDVDAHRHSSRAWIRRSDRSWSPRHRVT